MRYLILAFSAALCGCASTAEMASAPPSRIYHSAIARDAVAECLLNRVSTQDMRPERRVEGNVTTVGFTGLGGVIKPGIYLFTIRDEGTGSVIEVRRLLKSYLANAETCF